MKNILVAEDLGFTYFESEEAVLNGIDINVKEGSFVLLTGSSGSGKSTLLRCLKPALTPAGHLTGHVYFNGRELNEMSQRDLAGLIGFVQQAPEDQTVTDSVWHELAFGLESLGFPKETIKKEILKAAEITGISDLLMRDTGSLSGGQLQRLNLAAALVMRPRLLLLDEPLAQLDPDSARSLLNILSAVNRELGMTVIMAEHRTKEVLPLAHEIFHLQEGRLISPAITETGRAGMPDFSSASDTDTYASSFTSQQERKSERLMTVSNLTYTYPGSQLPALSGLDFNVKKGSVTAVTGPNGSGKSTLFRLISGRVRPDSGCLDIKSGLRISMLPQEVRTVFLGSSLEEDFTRLLKSTGRWNEKGRDDLRNVVNLCGLEGLMDRHPYDLSGGQQQRAGLAKLLLMDADLILLDEPAKGLDQESRSRLAGLLKDLAASGRTVIFISHDPDFCASCADSIFEMEKNNQAAAKEPAAIGSEDFIRSELQHEAPSLGKSASLCHNDPKQARQQIISGEIIQDWKNSRPLSKETEPSVSSRLIRTILPAIIILIPLIWLIKSAFGGFSISFLSALGILAAGFVPFIIRFEKKPGNLKRLAVTAAMSAIAAAGRICFYMLPQFKPVLAVVIITGASMGPGAGFLTGAMSMLVSDMMFGQGPWTPWQMAAMGLCGLGAGLLFFRKKEKAASLIGMCLYGIFSAVVIYGGIMNPVSALIWMDSLNWGILAACWATGFPMDCIQALSTVIFIRIAAPSLTKKLHRMTLRASKENPARNSR